MMRTVWVGVGVAALLAGGCSPPWQSEKARQEVLSADPDFAKVLERRDELADRVTLLQRELALKKTQVERQIAQLRKEFSDAKQQVNQKIQQLKTQLNPDRQRVDLELNMATEQLKVMRTQRTSLGHSISRLRKAMHEKNLEWTKAERNRMDHDIDEIVKETQRVDQEIAVLTRHLHLLELKHRLLQL